MGFGGALLMWPFLGGLVSSAGSLLGGIFGQHSAENVAQENIANQDFLARNRIQLTVADAKKAGINPLAALGNATQSFSNVVGSNDLGAGIAGAGQGVGRALAAIADGTSRRDELENKLLEAKIANVNADTVHSMAVASGMRDLGATGSPPPIPPVDPRRVNWEVHNAKPLYEPYVDDAGGIVHLPTGNASTAMQNWASIPAQIAVAAGEVGHSIYDAAAALGRGAGIRGDVWRGVDDSQYTPF